MKNIKNFRNFTLNERTEHDPVRVKELYDDEEIDGFFLIKTGHLPVTKEKRMRPGTYGQVHDEVSVVDVDKGEFVMYDSDSDKPLHQYLVDLLGPWSVENAREWKDYTVYVRGENAEDGYVELYSW
jgi:hypothetical protein